jgi:hypothetical protein
MHVRPPQDVPELERRLHRWVREGLITEETAGAIFALERDSPIAGRPVAPSPPRRVPVLTEVIGYLGAMLALAAGAVFVGRTWDDLTRAEQLMLPGLGALVFLSAAGALRESREPAVQRLAGLLGLLGTGAVAWLAGLLVGDVAGASDRVTVLSVGATLTILAAPLYAYRRWPLQQLALLAGLGCLLGAAFFDQEAGLAIVFTLLGVAWAALGARGILVPARTALILGAVLALWSPTFALDRWTGIGVLLGVLAASGILTIGALRREGVVLGIGVVGLFLYLVRAITYYLRGSGAIALGFLVVGVGLMVAAAIAMRSWPRHGPPRAAHG